jgi:fumarate reductase flavoprotein subunit
VEPTLVRAAAMPAGTPEVPVVIVGAGACGQTAAIALRGAGIDCLLLERDAQPRGSTALSSGFVPAGGTAVQRDHGVMDDSPARFAADIRAKAKGRAAPHLVEAYTAAIPQAIALLQSHGLVFELLDGFLYPGHTVRRMHTLRERTGAALIDALDSAAARAGALRMDRALVRELWRDAGGRIVGVGALRPDGSIEHVACRVLLLACNGYGGNRAMVDEFLPEMRAAIYAGHPGNDGSAIAWGRALGARLADLGGYQGHGSWAVPQGVLVTWALMSEGGIQVNAEGRRFHAETAGYSEAAVQVLAQPGGIAWNVFDARLLALARGFPDFAVAESAGALRTADDTRGLAALIGCDVDVLGATLSATAMRPPWHAVKVTGALFHTQGGLDIDADCRVLDLDGRPLPNLLAAGGAARGVSGDAVWGYLSGNGLLSAIAGGQIAAHAAATLLAGGEP